LRTIYRTKRFVITVCILIVAAAGAFAQKTDTIAQKETFLPFSDYKPLSIYKGLTGVAPRFGIKTNLLYAGATLTPNLAFEFGVSPRTTIELSGSYSWIGRTDAASDNHKQRVHMILRPEYRWWTCERFNGHYFGAHAIYAKYNVSGHDIPLLFKKEHRYEGQAFGAGISYGYNWAFAKRWGLEFNAGVGYMYMKYDKFTCAKCDVTGTSQTKNYVGPTRAGISLIYQFK